MVVGIVGLLISLLMWERLGWQRYPAHGPRRTASTTSSCAGAPCYRRRRVEDNVAGPRY